MKWKHCKQMQNRKNAKLKLEALPNILPNHAPVKRIPSGQRKSAKFVLLVWSKRTECCHVGLIYSEQPQGKEGQKEWPII